jgi:hypothetical protein
VGYTASILARGASCPGVGEELGSGISCLGVCGVFAPYTKFIQRMLRIKLEFDNAGDLAKQYKKKPILYPLQNKVVACHLKETLYFYHRSFQER